MEYSYVPCQSCGKLNRVSWEDGASKEPICGSCKARLPLHFGIAEVNAAGLRTLTQKSPLPVVIDFWAPWCGPCKAFTPTFQQAARRLSGAFTFAKVDTEQHSDAGAAFGIRSIPTLAVFRGGVEKGRVSGAMPLDAFLAWLESVK